MKRRNILSILAILALVLCCACFGAMAEEAVPAATPSPTPTLAPLVTPGPDRLAGLKFVITGPDERMPMTVTYDELKDGKIKLENLAVGTYTVKEEDPEGLLDDYTFDADSSTTTITFTVKAGENTTAQLKNVYATATPTVTPTPEPTPEPTPAPPETVSVPVNKVWDDNANADGNRPASVTVYLNANGSVVATAVLNEGNGWAYTFPDLARADAEGNDIVYTVTEQSVPMYETSVSGYTITNRYVPETTSVSVEKIWNDDNNAAGFRPKSIYAKLSNGMVAVLNEGNGWKATISGLPTILNGQPVTYSWTEQESLGYEQEDVTINGTTTIFTNRLRKRPEPKEGEDSPPKRGDNYLLIDEYGTPLGVNVTINHVGDCFE